MAGEAIQFPEDVGDGALTGFHDDSERARDFVEAGAGAPGDPSGPVNVPVQTQGGNDPLPQNQAQPSWEEQQAEFQRQMMGEAHQGGVQHDLQPRGFTSEDPVQQAMDYQQQEWNDLEQEQQIAQHNWNAQQEQAQQEQNFQQMYGQSENEKGELRRALIEQVELNKQMVAQMQAMNAPKVQTPNFFGQAASPSVGPGNVQPAQNTAVPQGTPQGYDLSKVRFVDKGDDEMVLAGDVNQAIREQVAPYVLDAYNRSAAAEASAANARAQLFESQKIQMGITPQLEQVALAQQPWIANIQDPTAYLGALQNFKATQERAQLAQANQPNPIPQVRQAAPQRAAVPQGGQAQRMLRRTTYVEGPGQRQAGEPNQAPQNQMAQWEAAWAASMNLPFGERAATQRKLLEARGVNSTSGYRNPNVLTR